jgi:D-amino-acid dehydrogenase
MNAPKRVVVVGAGIAGLCVAYYLRRRDLEVTVLDAEPVGSRNASSYGNGGWICPSQAGPLPEPGLTVAALQGLMAGTSPLYFRPTYLPRLAPWLARFWTYCNQRDYDRGTAALAALSRRTFDLVDGMVADGIDFKLYKSGLVVASESERELRKFLDSLEGMRAHGFTLPHEVIVGDALHALEPALSPRARAGLHIGEHWHVRPQSMTVGIARRLREMGVEIHEGVRVEGFDAIDGAVRALHTAAGASSADAFVLAAGSWTTPLARKLGIEIPMEPGKGYSCLVKPKRMPRHGILFADVHAGVSPLGDRLKIAGTMEFSGYNLEVDRARLENVLRMASDYIELETPDYEDAWAGLRPMTADGLPILDWAGSYRNCYLATGYSMLGMTVSQPAGEAMAGMVASGERPALFEPFRCDRFGSRAA